MAILALLSAGAAGSAALISGELGSPPGGPEYHPALQVRDFHDRIESGNETAADALLEPGASFAVGHTGGSVTARDFAGLRRRTIEGCRWSRTGVDPRGIDPQQPNLGSVDGSITVVVDEYHCPSSHPDSRLVRFQFMIRAARIAGIYLDFARSEP